MSRAVRYRSTAGQAPPVGLGTALFEGLAPDGGLYLPERLDPLPAGVVAGFARLSRQEIARRVLTPFAGELPEEELGRVVAAALDFPLPLRPVTEAISVLELFHGPTLAFKDVGARFMARLMAWFLRRAERSLTVLVATSGDTGGAVGHAFLGVAGTRVAILYPAGRVSALQERQLTTLGGNVRAFAVAGSFDDCQRMAKQAFADRELRRRVPLTSANSINVGRLLPQMVYYFEAAARLPEGSPPPLFAVPSGNFGNLTAGVMAHRLGCPARGFVAATNVNDVVPVYLETGRFAPRPAVATLSNAMDVGDPSNFARLRTLYGGDRAALAAEVRGDRRSDEETRAAIRRVFRRLGYRLDPHTAVGWLALERALSETPEAGPGVLLATAHPAKFRDVVEPLLGEELTLPEALSERLGRPGEATALPAAAAALREELLAWG